MNVEEKLDELEQVIENNFDQSLFLIKTSLAD